MENKQKFKKLLRLNRRVDPSYLTEDSRKILENQGLIEEYSDLFKLPKKWKIRNFEFVGLIYDQESNNTDCYTKQRFNYLKSHNAEDHYIFNRSIKSKGASFSTRFSGKGLPEITLEQFKRLYDEIRS